MTKPTFDRFAAAVLVLTWLVFGTDQSAMMNRHPEQKDLLVHQSLLLTHSDSSSHRNKKMNLKSTSTERAWVFTAGTHFLWKLPRWLDYAQVFDLDNGTEIHVDLQRYQPKMGVWAAISCIGLDNGDAVVQNDHQLLEFDPRGILVSQLINYLPLKIPVYVNSRLKGYSAHYGCSNYNFDLAFKILVQADQKSLS